MTIAEQREMSRHERAIATLREIRSRLPISTPRRSLVNDETALRKIALESTYEYRKACAERACSLAAPRPCEFCKPTCCVVLEQPDGTWKHASNCEEITRTAPYITSIKREAE